MKTILYVALTANGSVPVALGGQPQPKEVGRLHRPRQEHGQRRHGQAGVRGHWRMDWGRRTRRSSRHGRRLQDADGGRREGGRGVPSCAALERLREHGHTTALVGGGAELDAAFLSEGLVDEMYLNILPIAHGSGRPLSLAEGAVARLALEGTSKLSDSIVQLRYAALR